MYVHLLPVTPAEPRTLDGDVSSGLRTDFKPSGHLSVSSLSFFSWRPRVQPVEEGQRSRPLLDATRQKSL